MKNGEGLVFHLRPGFRNFLKKMQKKYEIVVFSKEDTDFLNQVIQTIDPYQMYFSFVFGNEFLVTQPTGRYKDLRYLNRKLSRVVAVDMADHFSGSKNNAIKLSIYDGEEDDRELKKLGTFLDHLSSNNIKDVRKEIMKYGGFE